MDAPMLRRGGALAALLVAALLASLAAHGAPTLLRHRSAALPAAASGLVARTLARDDPRFAARGISGGLTLVGGGITARFTRRGVVIDGAGLSWAPGLRALGRGGQLRAVAGASPTARANEVRYRRGGVEEWYANTPAGLEQGFTLSRRPRGTAPVTLAVGALPRGVSARLDGHRRTALLTRGRRELLRYSGLLATDARGRSLPAWIEASDRRLSLRVDDRGARYPLRIDPFVQVGRLTASDGAASDFLGSSVAVSGDTIVAGAPRVNGLRGAVYVFVKPAGGWANATETAKLTASDGAANDSLGSTVAISGTTVVAGAPDARVNGNADQGAAYVFVKPAAGGWQSGNETAKLAASDGTANDLLGTSVGVAADTVVAGAFNQTIAGNQSQGAAYVFVKPAGGWGTAPPLQAKLTASDGTERDNLGHSVAISGDTVVASRAGTPANGRIAGADYVFAKPAGGWADVHETAKLTPPAGGRIFGGGSGQAVAISADTLAAQGDNVVYVFARPAGGWSDAQPTATLSASTSARGAELGFSVAVSGGTILAGDPFADNQIGAAYVFAKPAGGWVDAHETQKLSPTQDTISIAQFGYSVGVDGATLVSGAPAEQEGNVAQQGAAYAFAPAAGTTSPTSTSVACSPAAVTVGQATTCSATVSTAGGVVTFSSNANGAFGSGGTCDLTNAACSVTYTPAAAGTHTITARYGGDVAHDASTGTTTLTVTPSGSGGGAGGGGGGGGGGLGGGFGIPVASFAPPIVPRLGAVTTLDASASANALQYRWDLNADGTPDVSCSTSQLQTQLLPVPQAGGLRAVPATRVTLTVVGASGQTSSLTQQVTLPNAKVPATAAGFFRATQNALCSPAGVQSQATCVVPATETFGVIEARGCDLHLAKGTQDLPAKEDRQVIEGAIAEYNRTPAFATYGNVLCEAALLHGDVSNCRISQQLDRRDITGLLGSGSIELYECRGPIYINGLLFLPSEGHPVVISPQLNTIFWSHTEIDLSSRALPLPSSGKFDFHDVNAPLTIAGPIKDRQSPPFAVDMRVPGGALPDLLGLTPEPATLSFVRARSGARSTRIDTQLALPSILTVLHGSAPPSFQWRFTVSNDSDVHVGHIHVDDLPDIGYGPIEVDDVAVDYDSADPQPLRITGSIKFLGSQISLAPQLPYHPDNGILFHGADFRQAAATLDFSCPLLCPPELFPGVTLESVGFHISRNPWVLIGSAQLGVVDLVTVHGGVGIAFASDDDPWTLDRNEMPELPEFFAPKTFTTFTVAVAGDATVNLPVIGDKALAHGYVVYAAPGYVSFGGSVTWSLLGLVSFDGGFTGEFNASNGRFNFTGHLQSCVADVFCGGAFAVVSSAGAGACFSVGPVNIGGGVQFPSHVYLWPIDGCKWSRFTEDHVFDSVPRSAQADARPYVVRINRGDPSRAIRLEGAGEAPAVRVTGPGGQDVTSSTGDCTPATDTTQNGATCLTVADNVRIMRSPMSDATVVGLQDPPPGIYTIAPQPGSSFSSVSTADDPAAPQITGSVTGSGVTRTLRYALSPLPGEKVTFLDVGPQGAREIGTVSNRATGTIPFIPAPDNASHTVEAEVELAGLPVPMLPKHPRATVPRVARAKPRAGATVTVARFRAPRPVHAGRVSRVQVQRRGKVLRIRWRKAHGAGRYAVSFRLRNGRTRTVAVRGAHARITGVARTEPGVVTVRGLGPDGRPGAGVHARFRATARPHTILRRFT